MKQMLGFIDELSCMMYYTFAPSLLSPFTKHTSLILTLSTTGF